MKRNRQMSKLCRIAVACTLLLTAASLEIVQAQEAPLEILRRSISARTSVSFTGVRTVVVFDGGTKVRGVQQRIHAQAPDRMRIEFLAPDHERGRLSVVNDTVRWDYHPETGRVVRAENPPPRESVARRLQELARIAGQVSLQYCGRESIADREAHVIKVYTAEGVTMKKSWVDTEHYVTLKTQRFDANERLRSSVYYTQINFQPSFPPGFFDFKPPAGCRVVDAPRPSEQMSLGAAERQAGFSAVLPDYLPPGYALQVDRVSVLEVRGQKTLWLPFSNGVETFSLFQRRADTSSDIRRRGRSVTWTAGDFCFTLMGLLHEGEMNRVKTSISP